MTITQDVLHRNGNCGNLVGDLVYTRGSMLTRLQSFSLTSALLYDRCTHNRVF